MRIFPVLLRRLLALAVCALIAVSLLGCQKKYGEAIVLGKEYKPAKPNPTKEDPHAVTDEMWTVHLQMAGGGRRFDLWPGADRWKKIQISDRVKVSYQQGEYTGIVWYTSFAK